VDQGVIAFGHHRPRPKNLAQRLLGLAALGDFPPQRGFAAAQLVVDSPVLGVDQRGHPPAQVFAPIEGIHQHGKHGSKGLGRVRAARADAGDQSAGGLDIDAAARDFAGEVGRRLVGCGGRCRRNLRLLGRVDRC
jgi:hypothetical protein